MIKPFLSAIFFLCTFLSLSAQQLMIKKSDKGQYVEHKVTAGEGLYSIGRTYNVNAKTLATFNQVDLNAGLNIGQVVRIPLSEANFNQKTTKGVPVYYATGSGDGLMKISNAHNKVTLKNLREWNGLNGDVVPAGSKMVVGFLNSPALPASAYKAPSSPVMNDPEPVVATAPAKPFVVEEKPLNTSTGNAEQTVATDKPVTAPVVETKTNTGYKVEEKPLSANNPVVKDNKPAEESRPVVAESKPVTRQEPVTDVKPMAGGTGYFKASYDQQVRAKAASKNATVTSGVFKTTSGWEDSKYYLLIDDVETGSIVQIVNPDNNKVVYAKVLGQMTGIRQNQGLGIRVSSAAASALGVGEQEKFIVKLIY